MSPERFVECGDFNAGGVEQFRGLNESRAACPSSWHTTRALTGKDCAFPGRTVEEFQTLAIIESVEVGAKIELDWQYGAHFPGYSGKQCSP